MDARRIRFYDGHSPRFSAVTPPSDADRMQGLPESNAWDEIKLDLAHRLRIVREDLYGSHGGPLLARQLGITHRSLLTYETGRTIPAELLLQFILLTNATPHWLLTGQGRRYQNPSDN